MSKNNSAKRDLSRQPGSLPYIWKYIKKNPGAMVGIGLLVVLILMSILSPYILKYNYYDIDMTNRFLTPTWDHIFGCDELGRDILARVLFGARYTLPIGIGAVAIGCIVGAALGAIAGYFGGWVDNLIMRILDVIQSFPGIVSAIAVSIVLGTGVINSIIAIGFSMITGFARLMRANILSVRNLEYIEAAQTIKCSPFRVIMKHLFPNAFSPLIVQISLSIAQAGLTVSTLSFLGLGVSPETPEWGAMISTARGFIRTSPHMVLVPGLFIMITVISLNLIGDAVRDALDPKLKD